ncbi:MAG: UPF0182 family protein [Clostridia bacterium]|jgi:uncharacterized membrane protein (UPF0182 family)
MDINNSNENKQDNTNNQKTLNSSIKDEKSSENVKTESKPIKKKSRMYLVLLFLALTAVVMYVIYRGNYLEILELGENYLPIFWRNIAYMSITFIVNFLVLFILIYLTNRKIKNGLKPFFDEEKRKMPKILNKSLAFILSILVSGLTTSVLLDKVMLCFNSAGFGINDPIMNYDIGYFVFQKPFIEFILLYAMGIVVGLTIYAALYYIIAINHYFDGVNRETLRKSPLIKQALVNLRVLAVLLGIFIIIWTQNIGTQKFMTLEQDSIAYSLYGAGVADTTIQLWGYRILAVVIIISIFIAVKYIKLKQTKKILLSLMAVPIYMISMFLVLFAFQAFFVNSNELDKEKLNIAANIDYTKQAYNINVEEVNLKDEGTLTKSDIVNNSKLLDNIALVNRDIVLQDLNALQTNKGYYAYRNTQIAQKTINGEKKLVYISPREIISSEGTYNNKTYEYTHGFGGIVTSATDIDEKGNLVNLQKSFSNDDNILEITEPRIYFGTQTNDTVVTNSKTKKEFDYPITDKGNTKNAENTYNGNAGLKLGFLDRLILAIKERDLKLAFSSDVTDESKILINRNIKERAKTLLPDLIYDENPYIIIDENGKMLWVLDAYTTSNNYPYSQKIIIDTDYGRKEVNYIRNSIKVLIDAYDGTINFYITDKTDPIAMAYYNLYEGLFVNKDTQIPEYISNQFIYPEFLYKIQAELITRYHDVQPDVLYRNDDVWSIATNNISKVSTKTGTEIEPYYTMVQTVEKSDPELGLVIPYTPYNKQNMLAYMIGTYENGQPQLKIYKYPSDSNVLGPMQLNTQLEQDERIASELESLNTTGTKITKYLIAVPIDNKILYIEPIYQQYINEADSVPTLKRVIAASGNKVAIGNTLKESLTNLVSQYAVDIEVENTDNVDDLIDAIIRANDNLKDSSQNGDWTMMGKDMDKLQTLIEQLNKLVEEQKKEEQENTINNTINTTGENDITNNE